MKEKVFVDTSAWKAMVDADDDFHEQAKNIFPNLKKKSVILVTSNFILDETFTLVRQRCGLIIVLKLRDLFALSTGELIIDRITFSDEARAWKWFEKDWSKLSYTDCVTFAQMERLDIQKVFTFDQHFSRAGFDIVKY